MQIKTFEQDLIGLTDFKDKLEDFIRVDHNFVDGSLVIAINSKFGTGKTTFLTMWQNAKGDEKGDESPYFITLNAWESDYYGDPLFAILTSLVDAMESEGEKPNAIIEAAKNVGWFTTAIANQVAGNISGADILAAAETAKSKKTARAERHSGNTDAFSIYRKRKAAMTELKQALREFVEASDPKIIFLVDELDRCRPDYAIQYLETIKHIFDIQGAVFILAIDKSQLENSARTAFGNQLDFDEYMRKFVHREIELPELYEDDYRKLARAYVNHYLHREGVRDCILSLDSATNETIVSFLSSQRLSVRQLQECFRVLGHLFETSEERKGRLLWCLGAGSIAMAALKVSNIEQFGKLGTMALTPGEGLVLFRDELSLQDYDWWFRLFLTGGAFNKGDLDTEEVLINAGLMRAEEKGAGSLGQWRQGWGLSDGNRLGDIYSRIMQIKKWD